jgi:DNA-binding transcriptional ArsR family regulator
MPENVPANPLAAAPAAATQLDADAVFMVFSDPVRHRILLELYNGSVRSVPEISTRLNRPPDSIGKQFRVLRAAGVVVRVASPDGDGRKQCHQIPAAFRTRDAAGRAALDFGSVVIRIE